MNDTQRKESRVTFRNEPVAETRTKRRRAYRRPEVATYDSKAILRAVGPAHGIYGSIPGVDRSF